MAGIKGRSGRKGWQWEIAHKKVFELSSSVLIRAFNAPDSEVSLYQKAQLASPIFVRSMPQKIDAGDLQNNLMLIFSGMSMPKPEIEAKLAILTGQQKQLDDRAA